ncbi:GNAT family N-acetyltransferase [Vibrio parahaemolyticus]|uniref:GNAT family N-acetyltransferase n=1 Tax=Vibrio parahaemolyticus TaxID=670 RepID=UPI001122AB78|nr:GNAT family N-acetyltransferase [Vibrio parahaemolyticus]HCG9146055.1 GNAT family N-acetyltransferase [Vibrio parahaemolyticus]
MFYAHFASTQKNKRDEDFQFDGFVENLKRDWFRCLIVRNEKAGLVCFRTIESRIHIHLLIVFHPFQRQGLARQFFHLIESKHKSKCLSLSSLKNNKIAIYMYTKYVFQSDC